MLFPQCWRAGTFDSSTSELQVTIVRTEPTGKGLEFSEREAAGKGNLALDSPGFTWLGLGVKGWGDGGDEGEYGFGWGCCRQRRGWVRMACGKEPLGHAGASPLGPSHLCGLAALGHYDSGRSSKLTSAALAGGDAEQLGGRKGLEVGSGRGFAGVLSQPACSVQSQTKPEAF